MLTERARALLHEWVESESLRKHCEAVSACMRHFARRAGEDEDLWGAVGLLHDLDYEKHPNLELSEDGHPFVGVAYLREHGWSEEICRAILSHADYSGVEPVSLMEKTLRAVDELSGFVTAVALVRPDKSIHSVQVSSVRKKMKDKAFAAKVSREEIVHGAELLGMPLEEVIAEVIAALQAEADRLGLAGVTEQAATSGA
ncbi:MAG TPA: HDIG domain-containing metalloprotein [Thermomicrobiales bacterium]